LNDGTRNQTAATQWSPIRRWTGRARAAPARRRQVTVSVTSNPNAEWIAGQITDAFPWDEGPSYLIRDRDAAFPAAFGQWESAITRRRHVRHGRTATSSGSSGQYAANASINVRPLLVRYVAEHSALLVVRPAHPKSSQTTITYCCTRQRNVLPSSFRSLLVRSRRWVIQKRSVVWFAGCIDALLEVRF
jgi:hypothetical protein